LFDSNPDGLRGEQLLTNVYSDGSSFGASGALPALSLTLSISSSNGSLSVPDRLRASSRKCGMAICAVTEMMGGHQEVIEDWILPALRRADALPVVDGMEATALSHFVAPVRNRPAGVFKVLYTELTGYYTLAWG